MHQQVRKRLAAGAEFAAQGVLTHRQDHLSHIPSQLLQMSSDESSTDGARIQRERASVPSSRRTSNAFGSPGTDSTVKRLDLHDLLIKHPDATFQMRASGHSMTEAGIDDGDLLLVDRALTASNGNVVIAAVDGELVCRKLQVIGSGRTGSDVRLVANEGTASIAITGEQPLDVWGVVTAVIKQLG